MIGTKVKVDISGFQGILSSAKTRTLALKGIRAGIKVLVGPARSGAPKRKGSGALKRAQGYKAKKGRRGKSIAYGVQGARNRAQATYKGRVIKPGKYDHLVQGGTKPHRLGKGEKLARVFIRRTGNVFVPGTSQTTGRMHPGSRPNPYRTRAFRAHQGAMNSAITQAMNEELKRVLAKENAKIRAKMKGP